MPIISFYSKEKRETAKTFSLVSVATYMALMNNMRILVISTQFMDKSLENAFWPNTGLGNISTLGLDKNTDISTGIEGLSKAVMSNKSTPEIITNYTRVVFKDRLEILVSPETENKIEYNKMAAVYKEIIQFANKYYDIVLVDLSSDFENESQIKDILDISNLCIYTMSQAQSSINSVIDIKNKMKPEELNKTMFLMGKYDAFSKYNEKNISRMIGERKGVLTVPYATILNEAANEGQIAEYFIKFNKLTDATDSNYLCIQAIKRDVEMIIYKLQELQMQY